MATSTPILVEQEFPVPIATVWAALTEVAQMRLWFFDTIPDFEPSVGFETTFSISNEQRNFTHQWKITEVIPNQKIVFHWSYAEYTGEAFVHFELYPGVTNTNTLLSVTNIGLETFPQDITEFTRESCKAGWEYFIQDRLYNYIKNE